MGKEDTRVQDEPKEAVEATPEAIVEPTPDPVAEQVAELQRKQEELAKQLADKDRYISEVTNEKATLEARLSQRDTTTTEPISDDIQKEASRILEKSQIDPDAAGKDLANLIKNATTKNTKEALEKMHRK